VRTRSLDPATTDEAADQPGGVTLPVHAAEPLELDLAGHVNGQNLLHLQCHIGLDSISWARLGAHVTGIDFSAVAIDKARHLATEAAVPVDFVVADVCDLPTALHERFDIAVATYGIFSWIGATWTPGPAVLPRRCAPAADWSWSTDIP
jgi:2-polyprenyl-3-methyl-5-hydroxy-6-metoxy-1,4-benzoquinol methylase